MITIVSFSFCSLLFVAGEPRGSFVNLTNQFGSDVNTTHWESALSLSADGRTLLFASLDRPGGLGGWDIYTANRAEPSGPFTEVVNVGAPVNTAGDETWTAISADRKTLYYTRGGDRYGCTLWRATRSDPSGPFEEIEELSFLNGSASSTADPFLSADERRLFFCSIRPGGLGEWDIWVSAFSEGGNEFDPPQLLADAIPGSLVNSFGDERSPNLTADERALFFSDSFLEPYRPGGTGSSDIWVTLRSDGQSSFGEPVNLNSISLWPVNSLAADLFPAVTRTWPARGAELFFISNRTGELDIWQATWEPLSVAFVRGDANDDAQIDIADAVFVLGNLFAQGPAPTCIDAADANDDGAIDIADAIKVLGHLFAQAGPLSEPFGECGLDPTDDTLDCASFAPCN